MEFVGCSVDSLKTMLNQGYIRHTDSMALVESSGAMPSLTLELYLLQQSCSAVAKPANLTFSSQRQCNVGVLYQTTADHLLDEHKRQCLFPAFTWYLTSTRASSMTADSRIVQRLVSWLQRDAAGRSFADQDPKTSSLLCMDHRSPAVLM
jgi:hypothetical protein